MNVLTERREPSHRSYELEDNVSFVVTRIISDSYKHVDLSFQRNHQMGLDVCGFYVERLYIDRLFS